MTQEQDRVVYIASGSFRIASSREWAHLSAIENAVQTYKKGQNSDDLTKALLFYRKGAEWQSGTGFPNLHRNTKDPYEFQNKVYEAAKGLGPVSHIVATYAQAELKKLAEARKPDEDFFYSLRTRLNYNAFAGYANRSAEILGAAYDLAQSDEAFRRAIDTVYGPVLGANTGESAEAILAKNPGFMEAEGVRDVIDQIGQLKEDVTRLRSELGKRLAKQAEDVKDIRSDIATAIQISDARRAADAEESAKRAIEQAEIERRTARRKLMDEGLRASVLIVTTIVGIKDPKAATQIAAVANAVLDTRSALNSFAEGIASLAKTDKLGEAMTGAILTGNFITIGLTVASALQDTGPTADQLIMEQLAEISKQLDDFRKESRERFDRIDSILFSVYDALTKGLKELGGKLDFQSKQMEELRQGLSESLLQLKQVERRLGETLDVLEKRDIRKAWFACIGHERTHGVPLSIDTFRGKCIDAIQVALDEAAQANATGDWPSGSDWTAFADRLADADWASSVNLFRQLAAQRAGIPFGNERRVNPLRWAFLADMYAQLAIENPTNFSRTPLVVLDRIIERGRLLDRDFSEVMSVANPERFLHLLSSLVANYTDGVEKLSVALAGTTQRALQKDGAQRFFYSIASGISVNNLANPPRVLSGIDAAPLKDLTFQLSRLPVFAMDGREIALPQVDASWPVLKGAGTALASLPELVLLEQLGLGTIRLEYEIVWAGAKYWTHESNMAETVWAYPAVRLLAFFDGADGKVEQVGGGAYQLPTPVIAFTRANPVQRAYGLFEFDFRTFIKDQGAVAAQMQLHPRLGAFPSDSLFRTNAGLQTAAEGRHDGILVAIQREIVQDLLTEGSNVAVAARQLDGVVRAIRGLFSLCFPNWLEEDEVGRSLLFGSPTVRRKYRRRSKLTEGDSAAFKGADEKAQARFSDETYDEIDGVSNPSPDVLVQNLLSREVLLSLATQAGAIDTGFDPRLIDVRSLLLTLRPSAHQTSIRLVIAAKAALEAASRSSDRLPVLRRGLARLAILRTTHPSVDPAGA